MISSEALESHSVYRYPSENVVSALRSDASRGLSIAEAHSRLQRYGENALPSAPPIPAWRRFPAQFLNPLTILLLVATIISFVVWWFERDSVFPYESVTIFAIVLLNGVLSYIQEHRAKRAASALRFCLSTG